MYIPRDTLQAPLYVIAVVSNPWRYRSRWELYRRFAKHIRDAGAKLFTVEAAFGERHHAITDNDYLEDGEIGHLRLRTQHEIWLKENMINLGIQRLPCDWKYVAWVDADVSFVRPDWVDETLHRLQHFHIVQMFSEAQDLGPNHEPFARHQSFCWSHCHQQPVPADDCAGHYGKRLQMQQIPASLSWHPGFAWAARREALEAVGGLLDTAVLGASDNHMAKSLVGNGNASMHPNVHPNYRKAVLAWEARAATYIRRNVGYVPGLLLHHWHGKKRSRRYWDRWKILVEHQFDPEQDLKRDTSGLWQLTERSWRLRDALRDYFANRDEDSIDLDPAEVRM